MDGLPVCFIRSVKLRHSSEILWFISEAPELYSADIWRIILAYKKDGYRQLNVRRAISLIRDIIWLPHESHAGMSLPTAN